MERQRAFEVAWTVGFYYFNVPVAIQLLEQQAEDWCVRFSADTLSQVVRLAARIHLPDFNILSFQIQHTAGSLRDVTNGLLVSLGVGTQVSMDFLDAVIDTWEQIWTVL